MKATLLILVVGALAAIAQPKAPTTKVQNTDTNVPGTNQTSGTNVILLGDTNAPAPGPATNAIRAAVPAPYVDPWRAEAQRKLDAINARLDAMSKASAAFKAKQRKAIELSNLQFRAGKINEHQNRANLLRIESEERAFMQKQKPEMTRLELQKFELVNRYKLETKKKSRFQK